MGFLNTISNVPIADVKKNKFNKSRVNCTTQDFFAMKPVFCSEVMSKEDVTIQMGAFSRLAPMVRPTYARAKMVNRAFFVPYRTIWRPWNDFQSQSEYTDGQVPVSIPSISIPYLQGIFCDDLIQLQQPFTENEWHKNINSLFSCDDEDSLNDYFDKKSDFVVWVNDDDDVVRDWFHDHEIVQDLSGYGIQVKGKVYYPYLKFDLGVEGKRAFDLLINLGYNIPAHCFYQVDDWITGEAPLDFLLPNPDGTNFDFIVEPRTISALPLLSYLKVWRDWYSFQQWKPVFDGVYVDEFFEIRNDDYEWINDLKYLRVIFHFLLINQYDKDYFTCAEETPISRYDTQTIVFNDNTTNSSTENQVNNINAEKTPVAKDPDGLTMFSQFMVDGLRKLTNYMMRNKIAGGRALDRLLLQYGIKLDSEKLRRSVYLGKYEQPLQIMDVTQTASTEVNGSVQYLGDYAGKGLSQGSGKFTLKHNEEFGQLIIVSVIVPEISYYQGIKREMFHINKFDFFDPTFDNLGYQAVRRDELFAVSDTGNYQDLAYVISQNAQGDSSAVFGFLPRYAEYKNSDTMDILSGDYRFHSAGADNLRYFNLFRQLSKETFGNKSLQQCQEFAFAYDREQYDRIFSDTNIVFDHFLTFFSFDVTSYQPAKPLFDSYDFGDDDEHNKHVNMSYGGTRFV